MRIFMSWDFPATVKLSSSSYLGLKHSSTKILNFLHKNILHFYFDVVEIIFFILHSLVLADD